MEDITILEILLWALAVAADAALGAWIWKKVTTDSKYTMSMPDQESLRQQYDEKAAHIKTELRHIILKSKMTSEEKCEACDLLEGL